jgi:hypothetical protein
MSAVEHAIEAGHALIRAKELCGHGRWTTWLEQNFRYSARTAAAFMLIARQGNPRVQSIRECLAQIVELPAQLEHIEPSYADDESGEECENSSKFDTSTTTLEDFGTLSNRKRASDLSGVPDGPDEGPEKLAAAINGAATICDRLIDVLQKLSEKSGGEWIDVAFIVGELRTIKSHIRGSVYARKCCDAGCKKCRKTGWIPKSRAK